MIQALTTVFDPKITKTPDLSSSTSELIIFAIATQLNHTISKQVFPVMKPVLLFKRGPTKFKKRNIREVIFFHFSQNYNKILERDW